MLKGVEISVLRLFQPCLMWPLHVDELSFSRGWNFIPGWIFLGYINTLIRVENKNISIQAEVKNTWAVHIMTYKWKPLLIKNREILKMKRQKNMENIVLALSSALTTCLLLLQCYSILALKIMRVRSQLSIAEKQRHCSTQKNEVQLSHDFVCG